MREVILVAAAVVLPAAWGSLVALAMLRWWPPSAAACVTELPQVESPQPPVDYQI